MSWLQSREFFLFSPKYISLLCVSALLPRQSFSPFPQLMEGRSWVVLIPLRGSPSGPSADPGPWALPLSFYVSGVRRLLIFNIDGRRLPPFGGYDHVLSTTRNRVSSGLFGRIRWCCSQYNFPQAV